MYPSGKVDVWRVNCCSLQSGSALCPKVGRLRSDTKLPRGKKDSPRVEASLRAIRERGSALNPQFSFGPPPASSSSSSSQLSSTEVNLYTYASLSPTLIYNAANTPNLIGKRDRARCLSVQVPTSKCGKSKSDFNRHFGRRGNKTRPKQILPRFAFARTSGLGSGAAAGAEVLPAMRDALVEACLTNDLFRLCVPSADRVSQRNQDYR